MQNESNAFAIGQEKLRQGDLPSAILYLEAAAKQEPGNAEVWLTLGITLAENEQVSNSLFSRVYNSTPLKNGSYVKRIIICIYTYTYKASIKFLSTSKRKRKRN